MYTFTGKDLEKLSSIETIETEEDKKWYEKQVQAIMDAEQCSRENAVFILKAEKSYYENYCFNCGQKYPDKK